jgi:chromosomal replication initiator protein
MKTYWKDFLDEISKDNSKILLSTFLDQCIFLEESENSAIIVCAGEAAANYIKQNELKKIEQYISSSMGREISISVDIDQELLKDIEETKQLEEDIQGNKTPTDLNGVDIESIKKDTRKRANLDPYYRFENFIVGENNRMAPAAAQHVADNPGIEYNPFYIYGGVGLGKTHILQSIGNNFIENNPKAKVSYIGGGAFRDEFVSGLMSKRPDIFKKKYRSLDMLLLDDIQLLETAEETSKELFEIFQALDSNKKQMVFVSDRAPKELQNIDARLKSRFEKSLILPMEPPQFETRVAIIERKLKDLNTSIPKDIVDYMASNITSDVRKIEGGIKAYLSTRDLMKIVPSVDEAISMGIFKNYVSIQKTLKGATIKEIIKAATEFYGVSTDLLKSRDRSKFIAKVRHVAMYLACEYSGRSTTEIGLEFNRNHASVIHAREKVRGDIQANLPICIEIEGIMSSL